jgi:hypothetical protein
MIDLLLENPLLLLFVVLGVVPLPRHHAPEGNRRTMVDSELRGASR